MSIADGWGHQPGESERNLDNLFVMTVLAIEYSLSSPDGALACGDNNTGNADEFADQVTLQVSDHLGVLIGEDLHLELWGNLHVWIHLVIVVRPVDSLDGGLKDLNEIAWIVSETSDQHLIEGVEMLHLNFEEVLAPLRVTLELLSVDEGVVHLSLPDEVHELIFELSKTLLVLITHVVLGIDQILISEVDLISVECHLFKLFILGGTNLIHLINILR